MMSFRPYCLQLIFLFTSEIAAIYSYPEIHLCPYVVCAMFAYSRLTEFGANFVAKSRENQNRSA